MCELLDFRIRLAEKFHGNAGEPVTGKRKPGQESRPFEAAPLRDNAEHDEEKQPFEPCLVQLARMARLGVHVGKYHGPWNAAWTAPMLLVDEISNAHQKKPERSKRRAQICNRKEWDLETVGKIANREQ